MNCTEQVALTFDTLKRVTQSGIGDIVIGILNYHPEIKSSNNIPGTEQTLYDYIQQNYPNTPTGSLMPKIILLENLKKHDLGEHITVQPLAEKTGKDLSDILKHDDECKQTLELPTTPESTPKLAVNSVLKPFTGRQYYL